MTEATTMKERPILFRGDMVRAILDGRKDVTRRPVKLDIASNMDEGRGATDTAAGYPYIETDDGHVSVAKLCPYGQVGDHLWVRETFWIEHDSDMCNDRLIDCGVNLREDTFAKVAYCATDEPSFAHDFYSKRPSIFMPRWASRITLAITDIRVERLHEITEDDARREGVEPWQSPKITMYKMAFLELWNQMHTKTAFAPGFNPFVWRIEFKRVTPRVLRLAVAGW